MADLPVAVAYASCSPWHDDDYYHHGLPWPPMPVRVYFLFADGHFVLQSTSTFTTGDSGYANRYGYQGSPGTIGDSTFEPSALVGEGELRCVVAYSPSLGEEGMFASEADAQLDFNPVQIHWSETGQDGYTCVSYAGPNKATPYVYVEWMRESGGEPGEPEEFWTDRVGTLESSDQGLHKIKPIITTVPERAAQAAQPYRPATKAWVETKTERVCWIETKTLDAGEIARMVPVINPATGNIVRYEWRPGRPAVVKNVRVCEDRTITINHPAQPEQPAQPPVAYRPASVTELFGLGWNAGARSFKLLPNSGYYEFKIIPAVAAVVGLNDSDESQDYAEIQHALSFSRSTFRVMERGVEKFIGGGFLASDVFRIERVGTRVTYLRNGDVIYTSQTPSTGFVFLDSSLYSSADVINDPKLVLTQGGSGVFESRFRPMGGLWADRPYSIFRAEMYPLAGELSALRSRFISKFRPMTGMLTDKVYGSFSGQMRPMGGNLDGRGVPPYALFHSQLFPMSGMLQGKTGGVFRSHVVMRPIHSLWADRPYGDFRAEMMPMVGFWADAGFMQRPVSLPRSKLSIVGGTQFVMRSPKPTLKMTASGVGNQISMVMPKPNLQVVASAQFVMRSPKPTLRIDASVDHVGRFVLSAPVAKLLVQATVVAQAEVSMVAPASALRMSGGAMVEMRGPVPLLSLAATVDGAASIVMVCPRPLLAVSAAVEGVARIELVSPPARGAAWADVVMAMPLGRLNLEASVVVPVQYEAYAINLRSSLEFGGNEVTRYTQFPFDRIVRWRGQYVAMAADGLYLLGGTADAGAPIPWRIRTGTTDFKIPQNKNTASAYVGGRMGPESTFRVFTGEKLDNSYPYTTPRGSAAQNYRQKFGRGLDARYYALEISGDGEFEMDDLDIEVVAKRTRRI